MTIGFGRGNSLHFGIVSGRRADGALEAWAPMAGRITSGEPDLLEAGVVSVPARREARPVSLEAFFVAVQASDIVLVFACGALVWSRMSRPGSDSNRDGAILALVVGSSMAVVALHQLGGYRRARFRADLQAACIAGALLLGAVGLQAALDLLGAGFGSSLLRAVEWVTFSGISLAGSRAVALRVLSGWRAAGRTRRRIMLVGARETTASVLAELERSCGRDIHVLGVYADQPTEREQSPCRAPAQSSDMPALLRQAARHRPDAILLGLDPAERARIGVALDALSDIDADVYLVRFQRGGVQVLESGRLGGGAVELISRRPLDMWQAAQKRVFDTTCSLLILALCAPLLLLVAASIRLDSTGPVLFRQPRIGFRNAPFICFKLRTMQDHLADRYADRQTEPRDPRVTRMGRLLRATSLDELPQLLNVLRGEMSLVGPRPHAPNTKAAGRLFAEIVPNYASRHRVKPGITGWAQVNGLRGQTTTFRDIRERVRYDLYYIENWSLLFDCRILLATLFRGFVSPKAF